jgi:hypothetical protein
VQIRVDQVPDGVRLVAGMTATVQIRPTRPSVMPGKSDALSRHDRGNSSSGESIPVK